mmetsp:Transcript_42974/g.77304  ORF Transcript_42974/g.77304 Transcript_42974/m.77304 type:complete len:614 (+) Transcript_42974:43-1884(+)
MVLHPGMVSTEMTPAASDTEMLALLRSEFKRLGEQLCQSVQEELRAVQGSKAAWSNVGTDGVAELPHQLASPKLQSLSEEPLSTHQWHSYVKNLSAAELANDLHMANKVTRQWKKSLKAKSGKPEDLDGVPPDVWQDDIMDMPGSAHAMEMDEAATSNTKTHQDNAWSGKFKTKSELRHSETSLVGYKRDPDHDSWLRKSMERIICSPQFELAVMALIAINSLMVGVQTQYMAAEVMDLVPLPYRVYDLSYLAICALELVARFYVQRLDFFRTWGWQWNVFDLIIVCGQLLEEVFFSISSASKAHASIPLLSIVRVLRALRVVRVMKVLSRAQDLRLIVSCIVHSLKPLFWSLMVVFMMTYTASLYITQIATAVRAGPLPENETDLLAVEELSTLYGSLSKTVLSLFQGITGGHDWDTLVKPLWKFVSPWAVVLLVMYIAFALLAVLNVVTGMFCQNAIESATADKEIATMMKLEQQKHYAATMRSVFGQIDEDGSEGITLAELSRNLREPEMLAFFDSMGLDANDAWSMFSLMDDDRSGKIDIDEFISGCLLFRGNAKAIHVAKIKHDQKVAKAILQDLQRELRAVHDAIRRRPQRMLNGSKSKTRQSQESL